MRKVSWPIAVFAALGVALVAATVWPTLDLIVSGWFYEAGKGFFLSENPICEFLHDLAVRGAWALGAIFVVFLPIAFFRKRGVGGLPAKGWLFLLLALLLGPVLIANLGFKDHWGRARPREVAEFNGWKQFSPALVPQPYPEKNESFVSGDGAFGFYLPSFAYLVPLSTRRRESKRVFWGGMVCGGIFAIDRLVMGGHFLSDNLYAALFVLLATAALHALMYGRQTTRDYWRAWLNFD